MPNNTYTSRNDLPKELPNEKTFFCILCGVSPVIKVKKADGTTLYQCKSCGKESERFVAWDPGMEQYFNDNDELVHASVGVIVQNAQKSILLFKRVKYPFLWTIPAGHLDKGEEPMLAASRELREETQIVVSELKEIFNGEIRGDCCVGGSDIHYWHAYLCRVQDNIMPVIEEEEGREWGWFSLDKLPEVTMPVSHLLRQSEVVRTLTAQ